MSHPKAHVLLVRHAECVMNLGLALRVGGRSNSSPLTALGVDQADAVGAHLRKTLSETPRIYSSTAVRARETALSVLKHLTLSADTLTESEQLLELEMGEWEGALRAECYTPEALAAIGGDTLNFAPPGGESQRQVEERMLAFLSDVVLPAAREEGRPAIVVGHGLAIKCVLRGVLGSAAPMTRRIRMDNTGVTELQYQFSGPDAGWHLLRVNDTRHLCPQQLGLYIK